MQYLLLAWTVFLLGVVGVPAYADGTHGVKVTVVNNSGHKVEIKTYNSKDKSMFVPHKVYYADAGGTRIVKAHGQGTDRLKLDVVAGGKFNWACYDPRGTVIKASKGKRTDGDTVTVASCYQSDSF